MTYYIYKENMERLEKKLTRIKNKCKEFGKEFSYIKGEEEIRNSGKTDEQKNPIFLTYIPVEVHGKAQLDNWEFVCEIENQKTGNIFHGNYEIEIPERYRHCSLCCEHCNTSHVRKKTFLVRNTETKEFKQVGRSCLKDFTNGMDAAEISHWISLFTELIKGEEPYTGMSITPCLETKEFLKFCAETIRHYGYEKHDYYSGVSGTGYMAQEFMDYFHGRRYSTEWVKTIEQRISDTGFDVDKVSDSYINDLLNWIENINTENTYLHNLQVACTSEYMEPRNIYLVASAFPTYDKQLEYERQKREQERRKLKEIEEGKCSEWVGKVKDRIEIIPTSIKVLTSWSGSYDGWNETITYVYKIVDEAGNVYTWKTATIIDESLLGDDVEITGTIKGTVKEHKIYKDQKQTELTRCKVDLKKVSE